MDTTSAPQLESTKAMTIDARDAKQTLLTSINDSLLFREFLIAARRSLMLGKLSRPRDLPVFVVYRSK